MNTKFVQQIILGKRKILQASSGSLKKAKLDDEASVSTALADVEKDGDEK